MAGLEQRELTVGPHGHFQHRPSTFPALHTIYLPTQRLRRAPNYTENTTGGQRR